MTRITAICATLMVVVLSVGLPANDAREADSLQSPSPAPETTALDSGQPIERRLARGEEHRYQLTLTSGEVASIIVDQRGIDVTVQLRAADGSALADIDDESRNRGHEQVDVAAAVGGTYTIAINASPGVNSPASYAIHMAGRRAATDVDRAMQTVRTMRTGAAQLYERQRPEEAQSLLERALPLAERVWGPDDEHVARIAADLAAIYVDFADFARAHALYDRALAILDHTLGADHPTTAFVRSRLASSYQRTGQRPKAEALLRPALEVIEKTLGPEHLWFVRCLGTWSALRHDAGDFDQAEEIVRRQLTILETIAYTESTLYASLLNNLGEIYTRKRDYVRAEDFLRRSVAAYEKMRGPDEYALSYPLTNLGIIARERKDFATAEALYLRALSIRQRLAGPEHPDLVIILNNLANILLATGDYARSLDTHFYALRIGEKALGPYHQNTLLSVGNIARTHAAAGDLASALTFQSRADAIIERQFALNLAVGSERQKLAFVRSMSERTERTISLHLRDAPHNPRATALAALVLLQRKGRVQDALIDTVAVMRQRIGSADDRSLLDRLRSTNAELARLALNAPATAHPETRQTAITALDTQRERLEAELAEHSAEFRSQMRPVTLDAVQALIPDDAALVEFTIFRPFNPKAERNAEAYAPPHYAAYILRRDTAPRGIDLGAATAIDDAITALRETLRDPTRADLKARARAVDARVMQPLRASFGSATQLLISPDGALSLMPFEALVDEQERYLIERYAISYFTSGRDLLRMQHSPPSHPGTPVIFANPVFGEPAAPKTPQPIPTPATAARKTSGRSVTTGDNLAAMYFAPLAATADEARAIKTLFPDAALFTGARATKAALQGVAAPGILHIASHGFFLRDGSIDAQHPLLRSGLALAGANLRRDSREDGVLTALEASGLNLWGTKLVTLSACDTGIGEVRNGEGVYGLRRAFILAGAETVVMSLWAVSDAVTRETMVAYYTGLRAGLGRRDALRQAKLAMLQRRARQHPFFWAGFIQSGEWANLEGRR
jgi:CHAT domain-containing protein